MDREVVTELIQDQLTVANLTGELDKILNNDERRRQIHKDYSDLKQLLQKDGNASEKAAKSIYDFLATSLQKA
jgi:lipid-A-disaccharide synthase